MQRKRLEHLFGADLPLIQAPMAGVQDSTLAIAVSRAGGLGSLPCGMLDAAGAAAGMAAIRTATDRPVNLNFFCHDMPEHDPQRQSDWLERLRPYYEEMGIARPEHPSGAGRLPFSHDIADAIEPHRPEVVSFHFGLPARDLLRRVQGWGATVLSTATTVDEALWLEAHGADAIIAQGAEAGGHRGMFLSGDITTQTGTLALVAQVAARVAVPVIAAGGIADARGAKAALALGATAVQAGTAFLLCPEATTRTPHRAALADKASGHTAVTNVFSGRPARGIVNRVMRELGYMNAAAPAFPWAASAMAPLRSVAEAAGSGDFSPLWCGQNPSGCRDAPAAAILEDLGALL